MHIQEHDRGRVMGRLFKGCASSIAFLNLKPGVCKYIPDGPPHVAIIVYDQILDFAIG